MEIVTEYLGSIAYEPSDIIRFEKGILGFETYKSFILVPFPEPEMPYLWLQSIEDVNLHFIVTDPFLFAEGYDFSLSDGVVERLTIDGAEDVLTYAMVVIPAQVKDATLNLQAPLIVNRRLKKAEQVVLDESYPLKYALFSEGGA